MNSKGGFLTQMTAPLRYIEWANSRRFATFKANDFVEAFFMIIQFEQVSKQYVVEALKALI